MEQSTFSELVAKRYSCRKFSQKPVEESKIMEILEAVRLAPSACNRQPWRFIVVTDKEGREAVTKAYPHEWIASAPMYIIACGLPEDAWVRPFDNKNHMYIDLAIATEHICLAATAIGLGSCWVCHFDPEILHRELKLEDNVVPVAIVPVGYPDSENIPTKTRKSSEDIVVWRR